MTLFSYEDVVLKGKPNGGELIGAEHGATKGHRLGIAIYDQEVYGPPGIHDDQESFYVIEGVGVAKVGQVEIQLRPGAAFIVQKGIPHSVRKAPGSVPVRLIWAHAEA